MKSYLFVFFISFIKIGDIDSNEIEVKVGDKIDMCCTLIYKEDDGLSINADGNRLKQLHNNVMMDLDFDQFVQKYKGYNVIQVNSTLCLTKESASMEDNKMKIKCSVLEKGQFKTLAKQEIVLLVYEELKFIEKPPSIVNVKVNESTTISCSASGSPDLQLIWRNEKQGKIISGSPSVILDLKSVTIEMNQMQYTCEASTSIPKNKKESIITENVTLNVLYKPIINVKMSVVHTDFNINEMVEIKIKGNPQPKLDCQLLNVQANRIITVSQKNPFEYLYNMEIVNVAQKHIGNYNCIATNDVGTTTKEITLTVKPSNLEITSPNYTVFADYYSLSWSINSKSPIINSTITIETFESDNSSTVNRVVLAENDMKTYQKSSGDKENNWKRMFSYSLMNLTNDKLHKISLEVCNRHECVVTTVSAMVKTPMSNGNNQYDPNFQASQIDNSKSGSKSTNFRLESLFSLIQTITMLMLPLLLQQIY